MKITLPTGCNVYYGTYIDNYNGSTRTRYYIDHDRIVANNQSTATSRPTGTICMNTDFIEYKPEIDAWTEIGAIVIVSMIFCLIIKMLWGRLFE